MASCGPAPEAGSIEGRVWNPTSVCTLGEARNHPRLFGDAGTYGGRVAQASVTSFR